MLSGSVGVSPAEKACPEFIEGTIVFGTRNRGRCSFLGLLMPEKLRILHRPLFFPNFLVETARRMGVAWLPSGLLLR
jgi:hypothetical protein